MQCIKELKLDIYTPKKDQCNECTLFKNGSLAEEDYNKRIDRKNAARQEKVEDKAKAQEDRSVLTYAMDLKAVLLAPRLNAAANYYKTKLKVRNWTFKNLATKEVICYVWHEAAGGLESDVFASIATKFIKLEIDLKKPVKIIFWSDGCAYQNRNVKLANALLELSITTGVIIEQKYLEVGHTQMEVDAVHSTIEKQLTKRREVYLPSDYIDIMRSARRQDPYEVVYLGYEDFVQFSTPFYTTIRPGKVKGDPCVNDICCIRYGEVKLKFSEEFVQLPCRPKHPKIDVIPHERLYTAEYLIEKSKYDHIQYTLQELKLLCPQDCRPFYTNLNYK